jgi:hypothetical protein
VALVTVLALGGCGGSSAPTPLSKPAYDAAMVKIGKELEADLRPVYAASSPAAAAAALATAQRKLGTAERELAALVPPTPVQTDGAKLDTALKQYIVALGPVITALRHGSVGAIAKLTTINGFAAIQRESNAIAAAGYKIG